MANGQGLGARVVPTPDACRRFLYERGDLSLGIVPQLLLDESRADVWAWFWFAARRVDDSIENGRVSADDLVRKLLAGDDETPEALAVEAALAALPPPIDPMRVREELAHGLRALGAERAQGGPPTLSEYSARVRVKAGVPLMLLNRLLLQGEDEANVARFSLLLAVSIQLGDDVRDRAGDAANGIHGITTTEASFAAGDAGTEPHERIQAWRESACRWLALLALERAERFGRPENRSSARIEALLWIRAVELGAVRETRHPLRWPAPLGDLLSGGVPTPARLAAARRVLKDEPAFLGEVRRWDQRRRFEEIQRLKKALPAFYEELEATAR